VVAITDVASGGSAVIERCMVRVIVEVLTAAVKREVSPDRTIIAGEERTAQRSICCESPRNSRSSYGETPASSNQIRST
jgi:hypothetical protein